MSETAKRDGPPLIPPSGTFSRKGEKGYTVTPSEAGSL